MGDKNNKSLLKNNKSSFRDSSIQLFRVISMLSIIICHVCEQSPKNSIAQLGQIFNVGVFCFLFISGYLYSDKIINTPFQWLKKNLKKIILPMYVFMFILFIINYMNGNFEIKQVLIYSLNLQYYLGYAIGGEHLWFLTIMAICYFFLLFLKKLKKKQLYIVNFSLLLLGIISSYLSFKLSFTLFYLLAFSFGYLYKKTNLESSRNYIRIFAFFFLGIILRILGKMYFDTTPLYDIVIFSLSHLILSVCFFEFLKTMSDKNKIANNKFLDHLDSISFYIYISHNIFISKPFSILTISSIYLLNLVIALFCSYIFAIFIKYISEFILRRGEK